MVRPLSTMPGGDPDGMQVWLRALISTRDTAENRQLLGQYLLDSFSAAPENFYAFLSYLRDYLARSTDQQQRQYLARQYLAIVAPLAARFGIFVEKNVLDERCFQILHPQDYSEMKLLLAEYQRKSQSCILQVTGILRSLLAGNKIEAQVEGRFKNLYSIFLKLQKKRRDLLELNDIFAFRIVLEKDDTEGCFEVLNLLHDKYHPVVSRFKDYISIPKVNGYQSIHTCIRGMTPALDRPVEVQIRTRVMDGFAKEGLASHWIYSQEKKAALLTSTQRRIKQQYVEITRDSGLGQRVYFFSARSGDIFSLPHGSTAQDFAYFLHSELGERAERAIVNGAIRPIGYRLQNNDRVEIIATPHEKTVWKPAEEHTSIHPASKALYAKAKH